MHIIRAGFKDERNGSYSVKHNFTPYCTLQLFHTATKLTINGRTILAPKNTVILFCPANKQAFRAAEKTFCNSYIVFNASEREQAGLTFNQPKQLSDPATFCRLLSMICDEFYSADKTHEAVAVYLLKALLEKTKHLYDRSAVSPANEQEITMHNLRTEMLGGAHFDWGIETLAKICHLSPSRFQVIYKQKYGISPIANIIQNRISMAQWLLRTSEKPVHVIAEDCGYKSVAHFSRQFKKATGLTPTQFRKKHAVS